MRVFSPENKIILGIGGAALPPLAALGVDLIAGPTSPVARASLFVATLLLTAGFLVWWRRIWIKRVGTLDAEIRKLAGGISAEAARDRTALREWAVMVGDLERIGALLDRRSDELEKELRANYELELGAEKRKMEAFLRGIGDGITIIDGNYQIIFLNDAARQGFGDHLGEFCYRVFANKDEVCADCPVRKAMETGDIHHGQQKFTDSRGNQRFYELTGSPIRDENGQTIAGLELARDVTPRIKLERNVEIRSRQLSSTNVQLRHTNEQLQEVIDDLKKTQLILVNAEKMASLGVLVSGLAHEINNPLNFVSASIKLLTENLKALMELLNEYEHLHLPDESRAEIDRMKQAIEYDYVLSDIEKIIKNITTGADRMKQIVENLRTFSRVDATRQENVNITEGLDSTLQILHHLYKDRIKIVKDYRPLPKITGNPGQLNQVFMNILHNAIQAIPERGTISICVEPLEPRQVRIAIHDDGVGISAEDQRQIFDPFFTRKKVGEGTGLGLSISYGIVKEHGGVLRVESEVGKGSTFFIELPTAQLRKGEEA